MNKFQNTLDLLGQFNAYSGENWQILIDADERGMLLDSENAVRGQFNNLDDLINLINWWIDWESR